MRFAKHAGAIALLAFAGGCAGWTDRPARTDQTFARIQPGMSQDDVTRIAGRPDETMPFPLSRQVAWSYIAYDSWGYMVEQSVTFDDAGRVVSKYARRMNDGGDHQ